MDVVEREAGDRDRLRALARREKNAEQKDRYLAALHASDGVETGDIRRMLCRSRAFVQRWAYAYRDRGVGALKDKPRGGGRPKLAGEHEEKLRARLDAGATVADGVCTLRGRDIKRIIKEELDTELSLAGVYRTLHRLGYSCLAPRPRHQKQDLKAQEEFKNHSAPLLSAPSAGLLLRAAGTCGSSSRMRHASVSREP